MSSVQFFNWEARYAAKHEHILASVEAAGTSDEFILKDRVAALERELCQLTGAEYVIASSSGTAALTLALGSLGIGVGDDVLTPAYSFASSASCIVNRGARPVFVDVDPTTCTISAESLALRVTPQSRAVIPVHLFSRLADMEWIRAVASAHELCVVEDSAVALGGELDGTSVGRLGDIGVFSFYPVKPMGGIGEGGALITDDPELARRCRMLRNHGQDGVHRFLHHLLGYNHRMDELAAAYLLTQLSELPKILERRAAIATYYDVRLGLLEPHLRLLRHNGPVYTYTVLAEDRTELQTSLARANVESQLYYPVPLHLQPAFAALGHKRGDFPGAEWVSARALALPLYPELTDAQVEQVADAVVNHYEHKH